MMEEVRTCHHSISIASDPPNSLYNILCLPRRWSSSPRRNILLTNGNRTISSRYQAVELAEHITQQITYTWYTQYTFTKRRTALNSSTKVSSLEVNACVSVTVSLIVKFCKNCFTSIGVKSLHLWLDGMSSAWTGRTRLYPCFFFIFDPNL